MLFVRGLQIVFLVLVRIAADGPTVESIRIRSYTPGCVYEIVTLFTDARVRV